MRNRLRLSLVLACCVTSVLTLRGSTTPHVAALSADLAKHLAKHTAMQARVIVHGSDAQIDALAAVHRLVVVRRLEGGAVVLANSNELAALAHDAGVAHLSGDATVRTSLTVSNLATAADQARAGTNGLLGLGALPAVNGKGITVAVVDSGINAKHTALQNKVVAAVSFVTGDPSTADAFGHGTHVAGIIAGLPTSVTPQYAGGLAPGANLVNVRVLGADGSGLTSDVIAGIDWVIAHKAAYNIRVINLSLGHPVFESCGVDPLCLEVQKAVNAGIIVVASAGNYGKNDAGQMVLGSIASPGNSPYAITVGALNTWGTPGRSDDTVATFSSRGPTAYDLAVKPDIAAPGVKIVSLESAGSVLPTTYPATHVAGSGNNAYMYLSGTSMAAPMVSGGVALLLQGAPGLSPAQVKLALQNGATYVQDGGLMGAGAGEVNFLAARKLAASGLLNVLTTTVGGLLAPASGASFWDAGTLNSSGALTQRLNSGLGIRLLSLLQAPFVWLNPSLLNFGDLNLVGLNNPLASVMPKYLQYGAIGGWTNADTIAWGTTIYDPSGQTIAWGTDTTDGETIAWGTMTSPDAR
ncbi:MAG TPA: S8 family peptidase [Vicinamibacterales bacterium]|nr:S8 family peptidase [Vicinamibacterales bacterium]